MMPKTKALLLVKLVEWEARGVLTVEEDGSVVVEKEGLAAATG